MWRTLLTGTMLLFLVGVVVLVADLIATFDWGVGPEWDEWEDDAWE